MLVFDHTIILTADAHETATQLFVEHGLATVPGGRHEGHGTANLVVPLGSDYLELMYVADEDEARSSPVGRWALEHTEDKPKAAALMLRTASVAPYAQRLGLDVVEVRRTRKDGTELAWRLAGLDAAFSDDPRPVFIECLMPMEHHPGRDRADHRTQPRGISWIEFAAGEDELARWLGDHDLDIRSIGGTTGPGRIAISSANGEFVI